MGIGRACLSGCPGVGAVTWVRVRSSARAASSYRALMATLGVPACSYQAMKGARSRPDVSAKHSTKASTVVAVPSQRWKYRSMPLRKSSAPIRVLSMRMISPPFS